MFHCMYNEIFFNRVGHCMLKNWEKNCTFTRMTMSCEYENILLAKGKYSFSAKVILLQRLVGL